MDTQLWYALTIAAVVVVGYIIVGFGLSVWITLFITMAILVGVLLVIGKKVPTWSPEEGKLVD